MLNQLERKIINNSELCPIGQEKIFCNRVSIKLNLMIVDLMNVLQSNWISDLMRNNQLKSNAEKLIAGLTKMNDKILKNRICSECGTFCEKIGEINKETNEIKAFCCKCYSKKIATLHKVEWCVACQRQQKIREMNATNSIFNLMGLYKHKLADIGYSNATNEICIRFKEPIQSKIKAIFEKVWN